MEGVRFGDLKVGAVFCMSHGNHSSYWNIKTKPNVVVGWEDNGPPANVINLSNGEPRTFHDDDVVYVKDLKVAIDATLSL